MKAGQSLPDRGVRGASCPGPEERPRSEKSPRWSVARRAIRVMDRAPDAQHVFVRMHAARASHQGMRLAALHALERAGASSGRRGLDFDLQGDALCGNEGACAEHRDMKASRTQRNRTQQNRRNIKQTKPMPGDDDDDGDPYTLPLGIWRIWMDVTRVWSRCHRRACKRGRACRGREVQCADELAPRRRRGSPEKIQRDNARSSAIFQRMLRERMALIDEDEMDAQSGDASSSSQPKARKRPR